MRSEAELQGKAESATLTWDPIRGGKRAWVCFDDSKSYDLGSDVDGDFKAMASQMLSGHYYPADAVTFGGRFRQEGRNLRAGDRIVQQAPLFGKLGGPVLFSAAEIYVAEKSKERCKIGYVTTSAHFGRGIWSAELLRKEGRLELTVKSIASPGSLLFWLGLPYARFLQLRARTRGFENLKAQGALALPK